jgi:hypothetical protein
LSEARGEAKTKSPKRGLRTVGRVKERNQNIRAFARSNEGRTDAVGNLSFTNNRSRCFKRIPVMNVSRSFRCLVGHEQSNVVGRMVTEKIMKRAIQAVAKCIVKQISGVNFDARGIMKEAAKQFAKLEAAVVVDIVLLES